MYGTNRLVASVLLATPIMAGPAAIDAAADSVAATVHPVASGLDGLLDVDVLEKDLRKKQFGRASGDARAFVTTQLGDGATAIAGVALLKDKRAFAMTPTSVDIAWKGSPQVAGYAIIRDGNVIAKLGSSVEHYRDKKVSPGGKYQYQVVPYSDKKDLEFIPFWGFEATVPASGTSRMSTEVPHSDLTIEGASLIAESMSSLAAAEATAAIGWKTFIPQSRIPVPAFGVIKPCGYDSSHDFGGDGRSWNAHSPQYRTALAANVRWSDKSVTQGAKVGATNVYRGNTLVESRTAGKESMIAKKLGSTATTIDVQFNFSARNPFCGITSKIAGAMIMRLTAGGSYVVLQGSHVQMPAHQVYILRGSSTADVYRASAVGPICLVGYMTCPNRNMTGLSGKY